MTTEPQSACRQIPKERKAVKRTENPLVSVIILYHKRATTILETLDSVARQDYANREEEGVLLVPKAGEMLFQLNDPPKWAGG